MIQVENLRKAFGEIRAVDDVSFTARDGEITGLLGPNGAGKTTTLRMLYTLMRPDAGRVLVDCLDSAADPLAVRKRLGVLPDARGLYKHLSARENIDYFAQLQGVPAGEGVRRREALIDVLADNVGLLVRGEDASFQNKVHLAMAAKGFGEGASAPEADD